MNKLIPRGSFTKSKKRMGPMSLNQVRMHAFNPKHCTSFFLLLQKTKFLKTDLDELKDCNERVFVRVLVKENRHIGFQVDQAIHRFWFWLKEIVKCDLKVTEPPIRIPALVKGNDQMGF
jgi:hypothetical protein